MASAGAPNRLAGPRQGLLGRGRNVLTQRLRAGEGAGASSRLRAPPAAAGTVEGPTAFCAGSSRPSTPTGAADSRLPDVHVDVVEVAQDRVVGVGGLVGPPAAA
ncbi:hypothetical protein GCM10009834_37600 [Streptomonospora arabica]